jgi:NAD(P) transhydrogenase
MKEAAADEKRVALTPASVAVLLKQGFKGVYIESDAGTLSSFTDQAYQSSGAKTCDRFSLLASSDVILKVRPPSIVEANSLKPRSLLISYLMPSKNKEMLDELAKKEVTALGLDCIPRTISRAQMFDTLTSMANVAGYRAVVEASSRYERFFCGQITAAGRIPPAKVLVIGGGVAGLAAVGTAKSMGAIVRVFDTRGAVREQVRPWVRVSSTPHQINSNTLLYLVSLYPTPFSLRC